MWLEKMWIIPELSTLYSQFTHTKIKQIYFQF